MRTVEMRVGEVTYPAARLVLDTAVGEAHRARIRLFLQTPEDPRAWLDGAAAVRIRGPHGERTMHGFIAQVAAVATADPGAARECEVLLTSHCQMLELRHRSRVFRRKTVPQIIEQVLADVGVTGDHFGKELLEEHAEFEHTVQYDETDAAFVRRLCEREGLWFRHDEHDGFDRFVLCDSSTTTNEAPGGAVRLVDTPALGAEDRIAWSASTRRKRRPGKVVVRDYNVANPRVQLEGKREDGLDSERAIEVYAAPAGFMDEAGGELRARLLAESLRADASSIALETSTFDIAAGKSFEIQSHLATGTATSEGKYFATRTHLEWTAGEGDSRRACGPFRVIVSTGSRTSRRVREFTAFSRRS